MITHTFKCIKKVNNRFLSERIDVTVDVDPKGELEWKEWRKRNDYLFWSRPMHSDDLPAYPVISAVRTNYHQILKDKELIDSRENYSGWNGSVIVAIGDFKIEWTSNFGYSGANMVKVSINNFYLKEHKIKNTEEFCEILNSYQELVEEGKLGTIIEELATILTHFRSVIFQSAQIEKATAVDNQAPLISMEKFQGQNLILYKKLIEILEPINSLKKHTENEPKKLLVH